MGREIKRVPLDFAWPLNTVWEGYKSTARNCPQCEYGDSDAGVQLTKVIMHLLRASRGKEYIALLTGLLGKAPSKWGTGTDTYRIKKKIVEAAGLDPTTWGRCTFCKGTGEDPRYGQGWERQEPPAGEGWQLWETVSEGSPISPVFATAEELAQWISTSERDATSYENALKFVHAGWAPTAAVFDGSLIRGIDIPAALGEKPKEEI
jgi:hypothetical protein